MTQESRFFFSGAWLLGLSGDELRPLSRRLEASREEIPEGRYRLRAFPAGIQILGERPGTTLPSPLLHAITEEWRCELKLLFAERVKHRGSEFLGCHYEHRRGPACLRRLSTAPVFGDSIGWVGIEGIAEPWEALAFARSPVRGQASDASAWPRLFEVATSAQSPVPLGTGTPEGEAEVIGVMPRVQVG